MNGFYDQQPAGGPSRPGNHHAVPGVSPQILHQSGGQPGPSSSTYVQAGPSSAPSYSTQGRYGSAPVGGLGGRPPIQHTLSGAGAGLGVPPGGPMGAGPISGMSPASPADTGSSRAISGPSSPAYASYDPMNQSSLDYSQMDGPSYEYDPSAGTGGPAAGPQPDGDLDEFLEGFWTKIVDEVEEERPDWKTYCLPLARIKKVMKSDEEVKMISAEAPILFSKACEIFISELTCRAWLVAESHKRRTLQKSDVAAAIGHSDMFDFLIDIVPRDDGDAAGGSAGKGKGKSREGSAAPGAEVDGDDEAGDGESAREADESFEGATAPASVAHGEIPGVGQTSGPSINGGGGGDGGSEAPIGVDLMQEDAGVEVDLDDDEFDKYLHT